MILSYAGICEAGWDPAPEPHSPRGDDHDDDLDGMDAGAGGSPRARAAAEVVVTHPSPDGGGLLRLVRKTNQDAIALSEEPGSDGLLMGVFDGHGEHGHLVARWFAQRLPAAVWRHPAYSTFVSVDDAPDNIPPRSAAVGVGAMLLAAAAAVAAPPLHPWAAPYLPEDEADDSCDAPPASPHSPPAGEGVGAHPVAQPASPRAAAVSASPGKRRAGVTAPAMRTTVAPPVRPAPPPTPPQGSAAAGSVAVAPPALAAARRDVAGALVAVLAELEGALLAAAADGSLRAQLAAAATSDEELDELLPLLSSAPSSSLLPSSGRVDLSMSGCTACVLVAVGPHVTVANVGDSRAVLIRREEAEVHGDEEVREEQEVRREEAEAAGGGGSGGDAAAAPVTRAPPPLALTAWPLSVDHKPTLPGETRRILLAGGRLQAIRYDDGADGPVRVWLRDADAPGLAMSRSLGDTLGRSVGVCGVPDVYVYTLTRCDAYVCVATDGLWEFTPPAVVAGVLAAAAAASGGVRATGDAPHHGVGGDTGAVGEEEEAEERHLAVALDALAETAGSRWRRREGAQDDLAILVAQVGCA